jgi:hydroxypyruvate reductase
MRRGSSKVRAIAEHGASGGFGEETPKSLTNVTTVITGSVTALCKAAEREAAALGYTPLC